MLSLRSVAYFYWRDLIGFTPPWQVLMFALFFGFLWANLPLIKSGRLIPAILLSLLLVSLLGIPASMGARLLNRPVEEMAYAARGFKMVSGCNGGAAVGADGDVRTIEQQLEILSDDQSMNAILISQLRSVQAMAKEKARVLSEDCGKRGHRENHPWKTNWAEIRQVIRASETEMFK